MRLKCFKNIHMNSSILKGDLITYLSTASFLGEWGLYIEAIMNQVYLVEAWWVFVIIVSIFMRLYFKKCNIKGLKKLIWWILFGLVVKLFLLLAFIFPTMYYFDKGLFVKFVESYNIIFGSNYLFVYTLEGAYVQIFMCVIVIYFFIVLLNSFNDSYDQYVNYEIIIILLICLDSLFLIVYVNDFMSMYFLLELISLSLYILIGLKRYSNISVRAAINFFIFGSVASSILLLGISLIYWGLNLTNFSSLYIYLLTNAADNTQLPYLAFFGIWLILVGLLFKLGIAPFHFWVSDVYEGAPTIITFFISIIPKIAYLFLLYRSFSFVYSPNLFILPYGLTILNIIFLCAYLSIIIGTFGAFYQTRIKRLLAYSAIVNMGFIILSLNMGSVQGLIGATYTFLIYVFALVQFFCILIFSKYYTKNYSDAQLEDIVDFRSLTHSNYVLSLLFVGLLFSLSGLPPFIGFFGKWFIIKAFILNNLFFTSVFAVLFGVFVSVYYIS